MSQAAADRPSDEELRDLAGAHLGRLLLGALRQVEVSSIAALNERGHPGVRSGHIPVFAAGQGRRITDLAHGAGMTPQMMGRLVRELEQLEYVMVRPDETDQRAVIVELTDLGWQFCHDAQEVAADLERRYAELIGPSALATLRSALVAINGSRA